jgi:MoCo/4Fe-4S cofactor protein with predicted Tat translocation signal
MPKCEDKPMSAKHNQLDLAAIRQRLAAARGKEYWRSLEELADTEEFRELLQREFPRQASEWRDEIGRRRFLQLMSASLALAGLTACTRQPTEQIVPYVHPPEAIVPGRPLFFTTAMPIGGIADGLLVESHEGRPTKIEGNPDHPSSLGATSVFAQASVLTLYDPDRAQTITNFGDIRSWGAFLGELQSALDSQRAGKQAGGAGLRILTETVSSPTLADQIKTLLTEFPAAKWIQYEPVNRDNVRTGALMAFGEDVNPIYHFDQADVILSLDADFLSCGPGNLRYVREFAAKRRLQEGRNEMNRLYVAESTLTNTGAAADHRLPLVPSEVESFARAVAAELGIQGVTAEMNRPYAKWVAALARDLKQHRSHSLIIPGDNQAPIVHALAHAMNHSLGNIGTTVTFITPVEAESIDQTARLRELAQEMEAGQVDTLFIIAGNPVYNAPADLKFAERMNKVRLRIHLGLYHDETSELCHWHIPETHYLESWSDARAYDGTISIIQPLIAPLYQGRSAHELLAAFGKQPDKSGYEIVRGYWEKAGSAGQIQGQNRASGFEQWWRQVLKTGTIPNSSFPAKTVSLKTNWAEAGSLSRPGPRQTAPGSQLEIIFRPDPYIYDGRFANNGWLQELPQPITKLTWDNAALISPATAQRLGIVYEISSRGGEHGQLFADVVELQYQGRSLRMPTWIMPGHADDCVTVNLGYGRTRAGQTGTGAGFNAYAIRTSAAPWFDSGLNLRKTGEQFPLATTQLHYNMEGRALARSATVDEYRKDPNFAHEKAPAPAEEHTLYQKFEYPGYAWGMTIDLNSCVGCNACVVACQAENNIPIVGKTEVMHGREMHWLRIDRYHQGSPENPRTFFLPVPCMQCEKAPCEVVCPVGATLHSSEGLNDMVYNRCVGTRYCSNNCPYKVRRFNFFLFQDWNTPSLKLLRNPDVTVRSRGVMEKCTYCVQRINAARVQAEKEERPIRDGEIATACQGACPAEAITFGDINDKNSRVAKLKEEPRNYGLLAELNTRPRTTYLASVRNPNPEIEEI